MKLIANISMMFTEYPLAQRLDQARAAGFEGVEIQFPDDADIAPLQAAIRDTGLPIVLINVPRGPDDAVGLASLPGEEPAFARAVETCARQAKALGARKVNVLAGRPPEGADPAACRKELKILFAQQMRGLRFRLTTSDNLMTQRFGRFPRARGPGHQRLWRGHLVP